MQIQNTLRPECMPEMVYSICRTIFDGRYTRTAIREKITMNSVKFDQFNTVFNFCESCGFISVLPDSTFKTVFSSSELSDIRHFRYCINKAVFSSQDSLFKNVAIWYLNSNIDLVSEINTQNLAAKFTIATQYSKNLPPEYILGFRFWMEFLGYLVKQGVDRRPNYVFGMHNAILDWLEIEQPFDLEKKVTFREFLDKLKNDLPLFESCVQGKKMNDAFSISLKVLHQSNIIELIFTPDSHDVWQLTHTLGFKNLSNVTEIKVKSND